MPYAAKGPNRAKVGPLKDVRGCVLGASLQYPHVGCAAAD